MIFFQIEIPRNGNLFKEYYYRYLMSSTKDRSTYKIVKNLIFCFAKTKNVLLNLRFSKTIVFLEITCILLKVMLNGSPHIRTLNTHSSLTLTTDKRRHRQMRTHTQPDTISAVAPPVGAKQQLACTHTGNSRHYNSLYAATTRATAILFLSRRPTWFFQSGRSCRMSTLPSSFYQSISLFRKFSSVILI